MPLLLLVCLLLAAGGADPSPASAPPAPGPPVLGHVGVTSLLAMADRMRVDAAPEGFEPQIRHMRPGAGHAPEREPLPCIQLRPPSTVSFTLKDLPADAVLQVAVAVRRNGYRGAKGAVTFRGTLDGSPLFEQVVDCAGDVPEDGRRWYELEVPVGRGGELVLATSYEGAYHAPPIVGFGRLRIAVPFESPRQRSGVDAPNVVLVVIDTLRADRLSCYGHGRATSPTIDRLAAEGLRCERAYASSSWTIPGTASVLTGLPPPAHGLGVEDSNYLPDRLDTLPRLFAQAGFVTAGFTTNPLVDGSRNFDQGFATFVNEPWVPTPDVIEEVEEWIAGVGPSRFFLYLHPTDPHAPYRASPESMARQGVTPTDEFGQELLPTTLNRWFAGDVERAFVERAVSYASDVYDAEIDLIDEMLGRVLHALDAAGHGEDTIVCITSDHGEEFLDHDLVSHFNQLYPESVHVPLVLWGPGVPRGEVVPLPVENRHVAPTLLALAGLEAPMGGVDLTRADAAPVLEAGGVFATAGKGRRAVFETRESIDLGPMHTLVDGRWQLITCGETKPPGHEFDLLFDLEADPACRTDVAAQHPARVEAMRARIETWLEEGAAVRPDLLPTTQETRELMQGIGYLGEDEE